MIINSLKVVSFITSIADDEKQTIKGGVPETACSDCPPSNVCPTVDGCSFPGSCATNPGPGRNTNNEQGGEEDL